MCSALPSSGTTRPTPMPTASAAKPVRHQASSVRSAASRVRRAPLPGSKFCTSAIRDPRLRVEDLQQLVSGELDLLVAPLGGAVQAGDQPVAVDPAEVAEDEREPRLRLLTGALGEAEVPLAVLLPGV